MSFFTLLRYLTECDSSDVSENTACLSYDLLHLLVVEFGAVLPRASGRRRVAGEPRAPHGRAA
jgi:hypothetical protein